MPIGRTASISSKITELKAKIKPGSIIRIYCDFISNPKNKYIVIANIDFDNTASLVFIINSEIPPFIEHDANLKLGQIPLEKTRYPFFTNALSYLNCIEIHDGLDLDFLINYLLKNPDEYKGELLVEEVGKVIAYIKNAQTIAPDDIEIMIQSLSGKKPG